jgi:hypothetical protein
MAARSDGAHPVNGVPTLLIVDDYAAVLARGARGTRYRGSALEPADLPIVGPRVRTAPTRELGPGRAPYRPTGCSRGGRCFCAA